MVANGRLVVLLCLIVIQITRGRESSTEAGDAKSYDQEKASHEANTQSNPWPTAAAISKQVSWDAALYSAPNMIGALGELVAASAGADFSLDTSTISGSASVGYSRFRPFIIHLINEAWKAMTLIDGNMQKIHLNAMGIPNNAKKELQFLAIKSAAVAKKLASIPMTAIDRSISDALEAHESSKQGLAEWTSLLKAASEVIDETSADFIRQGSQSDIKTAHAKANLAKMEELCEIAKGEYDTAIGRLEEARDLYNKALDALSEQQDGKKKGPKVTEEEVARLQKAMLEAQGEYDAAYRKYREASENVKNAEVDDTGLKYDNKRVGAAVEVLAKSTQFITESLQETATFMEFFTSLDLILEGRLKKSINSAKQSVADIISADSPRDALVGNTELRKRVISELSQVANDSMIVNVLAVAYADVSGRYIVDNLSKLAKLQDAEGADLSDKLDKFLSHIRAARSNVKEAIDNAVSQYVGFAKEWDNEIGKIEQGLNPATDAVAAT